MLLKRLSSKNYESNLRRLVKRFLNRSLLWKLKRIHKNYLKLCQHHQFSLGQTSTSS
jgi:hypothetical protein